MRGNLENSTIRKCIKVPKMSKSSFYFRPRSSGHLASSKRSSGCFFIKESGENTFSHEPQQFHMMVRSGKSISFIFIFLKHFA